MDYTTAGLERLGASLCLSDPRMFNKHTTLEFDIQYLASLSICSIGGKIKHEGKKSRRKSRTPFRPSTKNSVSSHNARSVRVDRSAAVYGSDEDTYVCLSHLRAGRQTCICPVKIARHNISLIQPYHAVHVVLIILHCS
jgi:hypothetical protein